MDRPLSQSVRDVIERSQREFEAALLNLNLRSHAQWVSNGVQELAGRHPRLLTTVAGVAVLLLVLRTWIGDPFGRPQTLGTIWVDSPEIYTRERLVNDRFIQDAWLSRELNRRDILESVQVLEDRRSALLRQGAVAGGDGSQAAARRGDTAPQESSRDRLLAELDFRELIRNMAVENQLDDRHDLNGNSLYRFKFDASVVPGNNTQATAVISVRLQGSFTRAAPLLPASSSAAAAASRAALSEIGSEEEIARWRSVYARWIESLRSRLNQTHKELKQGYASNEFAHTDYVRLISFLERNLHVAPGLLPSCPTTVISMRSSDAEPARLNAEGHVLRKKCVQKLIEKALETKASSPPGPFETGQYIIQGPLRAPRAPELQPSTADDRPQRAAQELDKSLNSFFASKAVQLVLGISVPEFAFAGEGRLYAVKTLDQLIKLSFFASQTTNDDGNAFLVTQKIMTVMAIDPKRVFKERFAQLAEQSRDIAGEAFEHFVPLDTVPKDRLLVSRTGLTRISGEDYTLFADDFRPVASADGVYSATAELGLLHFARKARINAEAFTYAVTPKESADSVISSLTTDSRIETAAPIKGADPPSISLGRERTSRAISRRGSVVGFGRASEVGAAEFGWVIGPRLPTLDGQNLTYVHGVGQYSLSALVSIPSWWNEVSLEVSTSWIGLDGNPVNSGKQRVVYKVEVPTDFEPLETTLLEVQQLGPELMESRLDPVSLTACQPGAVVIPGRRLWRSTRVTLGYQTADEISVLPNMKGIVAHFRSVQNQMTLAEAAKARSGGGTRKEPEIQRPVRVWTSQGTITLPNAATIGIPAWCEVPAALK